MLPYVLLVRIHSLIDPILPAHAAELSATSAWIYELIPSVLLQNIIACILIFLQAAYINRIVVKHRLATEITLFSGLIYILICSFIPQYTYLSPVLIANTFIIMAISDIYKIYKKPFVVEYIFNSGVFISLATMIYAPYLFFWIAGFICLTIIRSFKTKEMLQYATGLVIPLFLYATWAFYNGILQSSFAILFHGKIGLLQIPALADMMGYIAFGIIVVLILLTIFSYSSYLMKKSIQVQKKIDILYWMMIFSLISAILFPQLGFDHLLMLAIPLSILLHMNLISVSNPLLAETGHLAILILIGLIHFGILSF